MTSGSLPPFPFRNAAHDRLCERRGDEEFLDTAWTDSATRVLVMRGWDLALGDGEGSLRLVSPQDAPPGERMLLGAVDGTAYFLVIVADPPSPEGGGNDGASAETVATGKIDDPTQGWPFGSLRQVAGRLDDVQASLAVHAVSLTGWHLRHPRCSLCGADTEVASAGESRTCPSCGAQHFPRTDPAVIMLVVDADDRCLLGHNSARAPGWYSTLAGFVEPGESPEQAVVREVKEETGVDVADVGYAGSQPWPFPSSLMLGFFATASTTDIVVDGTEITEARWFTRADVKHEVESGELVLPTTISIAGALITSWYGDDLPASRS